MSKSFYEKVAKVQTELKAPKGQTNKFGGYKYRSCEDILEAVKPLLSKQGLVITVNDELVNSGNRFYIKATAIISDGESSITNSALAREPETKKGMDESQITGACSSYARKYALNGLLLIDDTKDADATETHSKDETNSNSVTSVKLTFDNVQTNTIPSITETPLKTNAVPKKGGWSSRKTATSAPATTTKGDLY